MQVLDIVDKAKEAVTATAEAEMPFLKGVEVPPREEALQAVKDSEEATVKAETALDLARQVIRSKAADAKTRYSKADAKSLQTTSLRGRLAWKVDEDVEGFQKGDRAAEDHSTIAGSRREGRRGRSTGAEKDDPDAIAAVNDF